MSLSVLYYTYNFHVHQISIFNLFYASVKEVTEYQEATLYSDDLFPSLYTPIDTHTHTHIASPHRDMKIAKKTVAGLSKRCEALAVPQAVLRRQKSQAPSHRGHMVKLRLSSHIS